MTLFMAGESSQSFYRDCVEVIDLDEDSVEQDHLREQGKFSVVADIHLGLGGFITFQL